MTFLPLTQAQKIVVRFRHEGWTQQEIANAFGSTKPGVDRIEKIAWEKIRLSKSTLMIYYGIDARWLCTLKAGSDILATFPLLEEESAKYNLSIRTDLVDFVTRVRKERPHALRRGLILEDIEVFLRDDGELDFF
ncbi:MAG: Tfx family DNA-binding protein [Methanoregulaceae archaeon]